MRVSSSSVLWAGQLRRPNCRGIIVKEFADGCKSVAAKTDHETAPTTGAEVSFGRGTLHGQVFTRIGWWTWLR
jgi:hypothetical protein